MNTRNIVPLLMSVIVGGLIGLAAGLVLMPNVGGSGSALPTPNFDKTIITVFRITLGGVYGLLTSLTVLFFTHNVTSVRSGLYRIIVFIIVFGVLHSAFFTLLELNNTMYGKEPGSVLSEFERAIIFRTAITELVIGSLIGLTSSLIVKFYWERNQEV